MLTLRHLFIIPFAIFLQACGGGGGSTSNTPTTNNSVAAISSAPSSIATNSSSNTTVSSETSVSSFSSSELSSGSSSSSSSPSNVASSSSSAVSSATSSSKSSIVGVRFKSDFSGQCLSTSLDATQGVEITQNNCENSLAQWDIIPIKGDLYRIRSKANGLCLAAEGDSPNFTSLTQLACDDTIKTRLWHFNLVTKINFLFDNTNLLSYELKNGASFFCVDINGKATTPGAALSQKACTREINQHWRVLGVVPDTADKIELNLLVITKVASKIPGLQERNTTLEVRQKQRFWSETALPRFFHDYTNGRVKLNVFYYESPYLLTSMADGNAVHPSDIPEDLDMIVNPGWFDGVFINHAAPIGVGGLVTFGDTINGLSSPYSSVSIGDPSPGFLGNDLSELGAITHEYMHQLEYYFYFVPERRKLTDACAPINFSMLDCGAAQPQGGNYTEDTDGLGTWMAFYRDFLNGYLWNGAGGLGDAAWSTNHKPREYNAEIVAGGPFAPFANQSTCLNFNSFSTRYALDLLGNNFATISNKNKSNNQTGESFLFDGVDDYLRMSNLIGDNFTLSLWVKTSQSFPLTIAGDAGISLLYAGAEDGNGFELRGLRNAYDANSIRFVVGDYPALVSTSNISTNSWVHIAVSRNQTTGIATLYINGKKEAQGYVGMQRLNKNPLVKIGSAFPYPKIGQSASANDHFQGEMADFCLLNKALEEPEVVELAKGRKPQNNSTATGQHVFLSDIPMQSGETGWASIALDKNLIGNPIVIDGKTYAKGLGVHAPSKLVYRLGKKANRFISDIGIDDEASNHIASSEFQVYGDNILLYRSGDKVDTDKVETINLDISNVDELTLITTTGGNKSNFSDVTDWGDAQIIMK